MQALIHQTNLWFRTLTMFAFLKDQKFQWTESQIRSAERKCQQHDPLDWASLKLLDTVSPTILSISYFVIHNFIEICQRKF